MSSGTLMEFLDIGNTETWQIYAESDEGFNNIRFNITGSSATGLYDLPADFFVLRACEVTQPTATGGWIPLRTATADDNAVSSTSVNGLPYAYRLLGNQLELLPNQSAGSNVRITYVPCAPQLSSSLQQIDGVNGFEQAAVLRGCIYGRIREEKDYSELQSQLAQIESRMIRSVKRRDRGTPHHTRDRRSNTVYSRRRW